MHLCPLLESEYYYNGIICGYKGSTAQQYAKLWGMRFISLRNMEAFASGDVNRDGEVSVLDLIAMQRNLHGHYVLSEKQFSLADLNGDEAVDVFDLALLKRKLISR